MYGDRLNLSDHYYHQFFLFQGWIGASVVNRNHYGTFQISLVGAARAIFQIAMK